MPKKRNYNFKQLQGKSSSTTAGSSNRDTDTSSPSVNERLSELRKLEAKDATAKKRELADSANKRRPRELLRFSHLCGLDSRLADGATSTLKHITLKAIAQSWELFEEEDYPAFADIPLRLRLRILSYIDFYGPIVDVSGLQALLQGTERLDQLDLGGLVGHGNLTLKRVAKLLTKSDGDESHNRDQPILESWDADESLEQSLRPSLRLNRAAQLTHLCLSHPGPAILWRDLLTFSKTTPQLTHLSLAYWPWPTLTPNLATTTMVGQHGPNVTAGGANFYAAMDQDMAEPGLVLRQLSSHLLCLQWLDIEGCQEWAPAVAELAEDGVADGAAAARRTANDGWAPQGSVEIPPLASNWKNIKYLRCAQGWLPSYWGVRLLLESRGRDPLGLAELLGRAIMNQLEDPSVPPISPLENFTQDMIDVEKKRARLWLHSETRTTIACMKVEVARRKYACKTMYMDYGWMSKSERP